MHGNLLNFKKVNTETLICSVCEDMISWDVKDTTSLVHLLDDCRFKFSLPTSPPQ